MKYVTEQRQRMLAFLKANKDRQFSVEELAKQLCGANTVSVSAIYRNINAMVEAGLVSRFPAPGSRKFLYQYIGESDCMQHFHLKCEKCGQLFHLDNDAVEDILRAAMQQNAFRINKKKTVLYGACETCEE